MVFSISILLGLGSCGSKDDPNLFNIEPRSKKVKITLRNQVKTAGGKLYGVQIYKKDMDQEEYKPCLYGLFEDENNMVFTAYEFSKYKVFCEILNNGSGCLYQSKKGVYGYPFNCRITEKFIKSDSCKFDKMDKGITTINYNGKPKEVIYSNMGRDYGELTDLELVPGHSNISMLAKTGTFQISVNVANPHNRKLYFRIISDQHTENSMIHEINKSNYKNYKVQIPFVELSKIGNNGYKELVNIEFCYNTRFKTGQIAKMNFAVEPTVNYDVSVNLKYGISINLDGSNFIDDGQMNINF